MIRHELYLAVLPLIHFSGGNLINYGVGRTEQVMTVFPRKDLATEFFQDEVEPYVQQFRTSAGLFLVGGHVKGYDFVTEPIRDGRVIVKVIQYVE